MMPLLERIGFLGLAGQLWQTLVSKIKEQHLGSDSQGAVLVHTTHTHTHARTGLGEGGSERVIARIISHRVLPASPEVESDSTTSSPALHCFPGQPWT